MVNHDILHYFVYVVTVHETKGRELTMTKEELSKTRKELKMKEKELSKTKDNLTAQIEDLTATLDVKNKELAELKAFETKELETGKELRRMLRAKDRQISKLSESSSPGLEKQAPLHDFDDSKMDKCTQTITKAIVCEPSSKSTGKAKMYVCMYILWYFV